MSTKSSLTKTGRNRKPKGTVTDVHKTSEPELFAGVYWTEVEYRLDGVLKIEQFSGDTKHEAATKATARVNVLLGE